MPAWKFEPASTTLYIYGVVGRLTASVKYGTIFCVRFKPVAAGTLDMVIPAVQRISSIQMLDAPVAVKCRLIRATTAPDMDVPIESFQAYIYNTGKNYVQISIPDFDLLEEIADRADGSIALYKVSKGNGGAVVTEEIVIAAISKISIYEGAKNQSITIQAR